MINSREKGKRAERELAGLLRALGFVGARRGQQYKGTEDSPDIVEAIESVHIECKMREQLNVYKALQQASDEAANADIPCVMHRKTRQPWLVTVKLADLIDFAYAVRREVEGRHTSLRNLHLPD